MEAGRWKRRHTNGVKYDARLHDCDAEMSIWMHVVGMSMSERGNCRIWRDGSSGGMCASFGGRFGEVLGVCRGCNACVAS